MEKGVACAHFHLSRIEHSARMAQMPRMHHKPLVFFCGADWMGVGFGLGMNVSGSGEHVEEDSAMGMGIVPPLSGLQQQQGLHSMGGSAVSSAPSTGDSLRGDMGGSHVYISVEAHDNLAVKRIKVK